jgi:hypothetical protein
MTPEQRAGLRKEAARLLAEGFTAAKVAERLGVTERVIFKWKKDPKFIARMQQQFEELRSSQTAKRIRQTGTLADAVAQKYQRFMAELLKDPADRDPEIMKDVREFKDFISREFHAMRVEERTDFGQLAQKVMHQHSVSGGVLVAHKHHVSFQRFVEDAGKEIVVKANNEQEALVMGTRQLLMQNPSVIDELQQEDHEAHTARLAALPKKANR